MGDDAEDFDFEGNASMQMLMARMGEIDKAIDDIKQVDKVSSTGDGLSPEDEPPSVQRNTFNSGNIVRDVVLGGSDDDDDDFGEDEDGDAGLADLQQEMKNFDAEQIQNQAGSDSIIATCSKKLGSPIGISMKTSKGVTKIVAINPSGLLAGSQLRPDLKLQSVNGISVKNAKHAKFLIDSVAGSLTLVAKEMPVS
mmetsp:Transcript_111475/g.322278  ORF Transcript_111475/g.322278 Transcript_111475/m.322278 type:complete len:196 (-) Transcript_111475:209-796(-)|eukprot:CAMPEP_0176024500 /NCGR_PEP_ID=MMETSP0120_2-20121206/11973_1 /TAXON_ID=160619 /ORGANISM="Kryptoperidinium foliaceum, Strain CCMP 1326" /LENGTH=195 /DNA_ID=CAMNT_0017357679 /DNA_START=184 /DNA_END=771 /DNA_ORIENTATION=+